MYKSFLFFIGILVLLFSSCNQEGNKVPDMQAGKYQEQHRPHLHFSPDSMWMNDPNGMVFYEGEYHLFYQYYPDSTVWGPMHWGHAISEDLIHWEHLPIALYPDEYGLIFSGSAVIDWNNTSGLGKDNQPPMVAIFTYHLMEGEQAGRNDFQTQGLAYSNDKGRTWTKYQDNPVIANPGIRDFRDPKVIWHEETEQWIMVFAAYDHVKFYGSPNLIEWTHLSDFGKNWGTHGGVWECPDLFSLTNEDTNQKEWVLLSSINPGSPNGGSGTQYFIGQFDGKSFHLSDEFKGSLGTEDAIIPEGSIFQDFENGYNDWTTTGKAFGQTPAKGSLPQQNTVSAYQGSFLANSFYNGDETVGTLSSPAFTINNKFINFQIAGGNHPKEVHIDLLIDGQVVRSSTGNNSEKLVWKYWDVTEWIGKTAQIQLVDERTTVWGHICVDHIMFSDTAVSPATEKAVWLDYGRDNYAGVTWSDIPKEDGRRIFMGWMSNWDYAQVVPTEGWRSAMTLPRVLQLKNTEVGSRIVQSFPSELNSIKHKKTNIDLAESPQNIQLEVSPKQLELKLTAVVKSMAAGQLGFRLFNAKGDEYLLYFDPVTNSFSSDRRKAGKVDFSERFAHSLHYAPRISNDERLEMTVIFDCSSVELLADNGQLALTDVFFPNEDFDQIELVWEGEHIELTELIATPLKRIW